MGETVVFVVATGLGNLQDITLRALDTLKKVEVVVCEDTRVTQKLLSFYQIFGKTLLRLRENVEWINRFLQRNEGKKIALVTDSGTPALSDPGAQFIWELTHQKNIPCQIVPIPGPSATTAILSVSGLGKKGFVFLGFLPRSPTKLIKELSQALSLKRAVVFYESPHRILATLEILAKEFPDLHMMLAREMTKIYEEILRGRPGEILEVLKTRQKILGEITVVVELGFKKQQNI